MALRDEIRQTEERLKGYFKDNLNKHYQREEVLRGEFLDSIHSPEEEDNTEEEY